MWALGKRLITNSDSLAQLERWKNLQDFQSNVWLLPAHCSLLGVKVKRQTAHLLMPTAQLIDHKLSAFPFAQLSESLQRKLNLPCPPDYLRKEECITLDVKHDFVETKQKVDQNGPFLYTWREATHDELFDAFWYKHSNAVLQHRLLCSTNVTESREEVVDTVEVLNAQETNNPFLIDEGLQHINMLTNEPFHNAVLSSLITVAAQFNYTSLRWIESSKLHLLSTPMTAISEPHTITELEQLELVHVSQLSEECQRKLAQHIPRYVLMKSVTSAYILHNKWWLSWRAMNLLQPLNRSHIPLDTGVNSHLEPLLWVDVDSLHSFLLDDCDQNFASKPIKRTRQARKKYYNASQLILDKSCSTSDNYYATSTSFTESIDRLSVQELEKETKDVKTL